MAELKLGDVVRLRSGGPRMTIVGIGKFGMAEEEGVMCQWFDRDLPKEKVFVREALELAPETSSSGRVVRG